MYRFIIILFPFLLLSSSLKILDSKLVDYSLFITFNKNIQLLDFSKHNINYGVFYDIKAELTIKRQDIKIGNNYVTIAQNSKTISRIVIETKDLDSIGFDINNNTLIISFDKNYQINSTNIADLFGSIGKNSNENKKDSIKSNVNNKEISNIHVAKNKIVVIDPGHGGKDCGAIVNKICEKTIITSISNKVKQLLVKQGYKVFMTRNGDKYVSLSNRTKFANDKNADIFVSIHANSLDKDSKNYSKASGIETYFLSPSRSERARKVAEAENKDDIEVMNYFSKLSFLNSINSQRMIASNKLAIDLQIGMLVNTRKIVVNVIDGGVREGPFWVLAGALMPSVLIEVGYMTNKEEFSRLQNKEYQDAIAAGILAGINSYFAKNF